MRSGNLPAYLSLNSFVSCSYCYFVQNLHGNPTAKKFDWLVTDRQTDGRTNGRTHPFIEMRKRIQKREEKLLTDRHSVKIGQFPKEISTEVVHDILLHRRIQIVEERMQAMMLVVKHGHFQILLNPIDDVPIRVISMWVSKNLVDYREKLH